MNPTSTSAPTSGPKPAAHRSVAFKLSLAALVSLLVVLLSTMGIVSGLLWKDFGRMSTEEVSRYAAQVRALVQTFDETAQDQAHHDFAIFKANFPGKFAVAEVPGADGKPEAVLSYEGAALNGDFNVVDQFLKTSGVPRPPSLRARGTTSSA